MLGLYFCVVIWSFGENMFSRKLRYSFEKRMNKVKICGGFHELQLRYIQHPPNAVDRYRVDVAFWRIACFVVFKIRLGKSFDEKQRLLRF